MVTSSYECCCCRCIEQFHAVARTSSVTAIVLDTHRQVSMASACSCVVLVVADRKSSVDSADRKACSGPSKTDPGAVAGEPNHRMWTLDEAVHLRNKFNFLEPRGD